MWTCPNLFKQPLLFVMVRSSPYSPDYLGWKYWQVTGESVLRPGTSWQNPQHRVSQQRLLMALVPLVFHWNWARKKRLPGSSQRTGCFYARGKSRHHCEFLCCLQMAPAHAAQWSCSGEKEMWTCSHSRWSSLLMQDSSPLHDPCCLPFHCVHWVPDCRQGLYGRQEKCMLFPRELTPHHGPNRCL